MRHLNLPPTRLIPLILLIALAGACSGDGTMAPVSATAPSKDQRILDTPTTMSDGSSVPPHVTDTVTTSQPLFSTGVIGGVSVDNAGNIYSANFAQQVVRVATDGTATVLSAEFVNASGNLPLAGGDLLQADYKENKIYRLRPDGQREVFSDAGLDGPVGMVSLADGTILVANHRGKFLAQVAAGGGPATEVLRDERMTAPNGVALGPGGEVYIADLATGKVLRWKPGTPLDVVTELPGRGQCAQCLCQRGALREQDLGSRHLPGRRGDRRLRHRHRQRARGLRRRADGHGHDRGAQRHRGLGGRDDRLLQYTPRRDV